jgi:hypothetical protein
VFARAKPGSIVLTERYVFEQEISSNSDLSEYSPPTGSIEIVTPYQGYQSFTRQAISDIEVQRDKKEWGSQQEETDVTIGYLALRGLSSAERPLMRRNGMAILPITVPVHVGPKVATRLQEEPRSCTIAAKYTPRAPKVVPIQVQMELSDEDSFGKRDISQPIEQLMANEITSQLCFRRNLLVTIDIKVVLPKKQAEGQQPRIKRIALEWPTITPPAAFRLIPRTLDTSKGHEVDQGAAKNHVAEIRFNPLSRCIEWSGPLMKKLDSDSNGLVSFACQQRIVIDQPGQLWQLEKLCGRVDVEVPRCISGISSLLFSSNGVPLQEPQISMNSALTSHFSFILDDAFTNKLFSPVQHLFFDGVVLGPIGMANIRALLAGRGFEIGGRSNWDLGFVFKDGRHEHYIIARRKEGIKSMQLLLKAEGEQQVIEEQRVQGENVLRQARKIGYLRLFLCCGLKGDSKRIVRELNAIHAQLRNLLTTEELRGKDVDLDRP